VWNRFADVLLTRERLGGIFERSAGTGLSEALSKCWQESVNSGKDLAVLLAEDRTVHRAFARLLSSQSAFLAICRALIDPAMVGVLKRMVSDTGLPCRRASATTLSCLKTDGAIPFLQAGLVDQDKQVRETSAGALQALLGQEQFDELIKQMESETSSLGERLKGLAGWAQESLSTLSSGVVSGMRIAQTGAAKIGESLKDIAEAGTGWLGTKAKNLFGKTEGDRE
jgi:hypothetical protein